MALTVNELRTVFTADISDFERGTKTAEQSGRRAGQEIARSMRKAGDDAGQGLEQGVTQGAKQAGQKAGDRIADGVKSGADKAGKVAGQGISKGLEAAGWLGVGTSIGAALGVGITGAMGRADLKGTLAAQLGASGADAGRYGKIAGDLWKGAWGDSMADTGDAVKSVVQNIGGMRQASEKELTAVATNVLAIKQAFDEDGAAITRTADQMVRTGLAKNAREALDVLTVGFQKGANEADDLLDTFDEYGTQFRKLGLNGKEATGLLQQGLRAGARDADTVADSLKEFAIRAVDGSKSTAAGFKLLGLDGEDMGRKIAKGGQSAQDGLQLTLDRLRAIKDPVKRNAAAVDLFGTKAEDLGLALDALDPETAARGLGKVAGAADKAGDSLSGPSSKVESFKRQMQSKLVDFVGGRVIPALEDLGGAGGKAFGWVKDLPDGLQDAIVKAGILASTLGGALVVGGKVARSVRDLRGVGGGIGKTLGKAAGSESVGTMTVRAGVVNVTGAPGAGAAGGAGGTAAGTAAGGAVTGVGGLLGALGLTALAPLALSQYGLSQSNKLPKDKANGGAYVGSGYGGVGGYNDAIPNAKDLKSAAANAMQMLERQKQALASLPKEVATKVTAPGAKVTMQDVAALAKQYGLTPEQVQTLMEATGVDKQQKKVADYLHDLGLTPDQVQTAMSMDTTRGTTELRAYLRRLGLTPKQVNTVVDALTSGALGDINSVLRRLGIVDRTTATPTVRVKADLDGFYATQRALNQIDGKTSTTYVRTVRSGPGGPGFRGDFGGYLPTVRRYAMGGGDVANGHLPEIARGGAPHRVWAEPETGGEAYIPLRNDGRRQRAKDILGQVAGHFGGTVAYAGGGVTGVTGATGAGVPGLGTIDFTRMTRAWLEAAQASTKTAQAAKATASSRLDDLNGRKQIRDLQKQLAERVNNTAQIRELTKALNARNKRGQLVVTGANRTAKQRQLAAARRGNNRYAVTGLDRDALSAELEKAQEDLAALRAKAAAASFGDIGEAARDRAIERAGIFGTSTTSAGQLLRNLQRDAVTNQQFAGIVEQLRAQGLGKDLLDQFTKEGASAQSLALGRSILATGNIAQLNQVQSTLGVQATQAGYQAEGTKAPGAQGRLVNIEAYYENGQSVNQIAEDLWFKTQQRGG